MNSNLKSISRSVSSGLKSVEARASSLATDKNVLYIMLVIAVVNVVGYLMMGNFEAVVFFAVVAYLSTFFTKNMVIVFLVSILATNFLMASRVNYFSRMNAREGMQTKDAAKNDAAKDAVAAEDDAAAKDAVAAKDASAKDAANVATKPSAAAAAAIPKPTPTNSKKTSGEKEGMNGKLAPAKFNDDSDDEGDALPGTNAQRNAQMEKAHDALQNIGSSGAMKLQTEEVMKQQKVLMDNIKTMQPFLETAERFLDKFNMKGIDGLLGKIGMGSNAAATPGPSSV
jgi:ABC-type multidrug transport system fused ATPase/permease subunit